ncbi:MAG: rod shape-determining protein MreC [Ignavibacteriae bacterium]|nr:rod shape-determining protein MreC [Ignavibacteriota bacterium]
MPDFLLQLISKFKEFIVLTLLLVLSLIIMSLNENSNVRNIKLFALGSFAGVNSMVSNVSSYFENTEYVSELEKQNAKLMLEVNKLREYALENNELKKIILFSGETEYEVAHAKIVSRLVSKVHGYFIVSKGKTDGIKKGMPIITDDGLVGIVYNVMENYSSVRTFENSLFKLAVKDQRSNVTGVLNWNGKNLIIKNVPTTKDVEIGDRIVVSELSSIIPPSIPIGIVADKETTVSGLLSNIIVQPFANLNSSRNILILKTNFNTQLDSLENNLIRKAE